MAEEADHFGCQIVSVREGCVIASVAVNVLDQSGIQFVQRSRMTCKVHHLLDGRQRDALTDVLYVISGDPYVFVCDSYLVLGFQFLYLPIFIWPFGRVGGA